MPRREGFSSADSHTLLIGSYGCCGSVFKSGKTEAGNRKLERGCGKEPKARSH